jgi:hypothetical protein
METGAYMRAHSRDMHVHIEKHAVLGHTLDQTLLGLSIVVLILVGHYPCYESHNFRIINSFLALVFPSVFF